MLEKKIDRGRNFLTQHLELFRCPICHASYKMLEGNHITCGNHHQLDLSKKGTLFFLNHPVKTGYDQEMLTHRKKMIELGLYEPMLQEISEVMKQTEEKAIIDVGCGEGTFLNKLADLGVAGTKIGFDISKDGVAMATDQPIDAFWCVADLTNLPFADNCVSHLLNIFSPSHYEEFHRVLQDEGKVIKIVPSSNYLQELREIFYEGNEARYVYSNDEVVKKFCEEMNVEMEKRITYQFPIEKENQEDLVKMSPLHWGASEQKKQEALNQRIELITIDVLLLVGYK